MSIGIWQIAIIVLVLLLLFGAGKLPRLMGDVAAGIKAFKRGMEDDTSDTADKEPIENAPKTKSKKK